MCCRHTNIHSPCNFQYWLLRSTQSHPTTCKTTDWAKQDWHFMSFAYRLSFVFGAEVVRFFFCCFLDPVVFPFLAVWLKRTRCAVWHCNRVVISSLKNTQVEAVNGLTSFNYTTTTHIHTQPLTDSVSFPCFSPKMGTEVVGCVGCPVNQHFLSHWFKHVCLHTLTFSPHICSRANFSLAVT